MGEPVPINRPQLDEHLEPIYKIAFDESLRRLAAQAAQREAIRTRLLALLSVVTAGSAFLAGTAVQATHREVGYYVFTAAATVFYAGTVAITARVLRPLDWLSETSAEAIIAEYAETADRASTSRAYRDIALHNDLHADANDEVLKGMHTLFSAALVTAGCDVVSLLVVAWLVAR